MYTRQMVAENKAMLKYAEELWGVTQSMGLVMSYMILGFQSIDEKRIERWVLRADRELRRKEETL